MFKPAIAAIVVLVLWFSSRDNSVEQRCPDTPFVRPSAKHFENVRKIVSDEAYKLKSVERLLGAVQVVTVLDDNAPNVEDDANYWRVRFDPFHKYLESAFPVIWDLCSVEKVNEWGLVLTWSGSDTSLKPLVLTAHQDTTPASGDSWKYPPFEGKFDGENVWGRGSADCKNLLVGLLEAVEALHLDGFKPKRTVVLAFGFDEEIGGNNGAKHINTFLVDRYGKNGVHAIIDEGGQGLVEQDGVAMALVGTGEKGMLNFHVSLTAPGGHSSVPPDHTAIGVMSELVTQMEKTAFVPRFTKRNPTYHQYQCVAEHSNQLPRSVRKSIFRDTVVARNKVARYLYGLGGTTRYLVTTSQAVDIIIGGEKSNALPESAQLVVNHRVGVESQLDEVYLRDLMLVKQVAEKFDYGLVAGHPILNGTKNGVFNVSTSWELEPAPLTPIFDKTWFNLAGVIRHTYEEICKDIMGDFRGRRVVVAPGMATGNTDTQHYWNLTRHIYRYRPGIITSVEAHAHGTNEFIPIASHLQLIAFYHQFLQVE